MTARLATTLRVVLLLAAAAPLSLTLEAQQPRPLGPPRERLLMEQRVRERFDDIVRVQLGLDAPTAQRLLEAVRSFQEERELLLRRDMELRRRLRLEAGGRAPGRGGELMADPEARQVLEEMAELRRQEAELYEREQGRLLEVLTPGQLVRFYLLREEMAERLRRIRGGPPGPVGGAPGPGRRPGEALAPGGDRAGWWLPLPG